MAKLALKIEKYTDGSEIHYDSKGNEIYYKNTDGLESWQEFDKNNNMIHYKNYNGLEYWKEYDENDNLIHYKNSKGIEYFYINNKKVLKEEWEKYYNSNKIVIQGREYKLSDESVEALKQMLKDLI